MLRILKYVSINGKVMRHIGKLLRKLAHHYPDIAGLLPKKEYDGRFDLLCRIQGGELVLVEMQVLPQDFWDQRALAYACSVYCRQMEVGMKWGDIKRVISVNILGGGRQDIRHWPREKDFKQHYCFRDDAGHTMR